MSTGLLTDQYELAMAASYLRRDMNDHAVFDLFARELPRHRAWLLVAGLEPALRMVESIRFGPRELRYLAGLGFDDAFLDYLAGFRFTGDIDAMPEGTIAFAEEPLLQVTAPRIEAQLLETLLLNQINFQTAIATKAARIVLAIGGGRPDRGGKLVDFSARRDHGADAAMKAARAAAIAGAGGTSCVAAAMRYGIVPVGTMAHSYVMSFAHEQEAFEAFMADVPENAIMLVDTYDTIAGVRHAIAASRATGVALEGIRLDSGDLSELSFAARRELDRAGFEDAVIVASGDLDEFQIASLVASGAPIDRYGVGTELGTSRDSPTLGGVYKLVADHGPCRWRDLVKLSPAKATLPGRKQVWRMAGAEGEMLADYLGAADEQRSGRRLLVPAMRGGEIVCRETIEQMRARALDGLDALPAQLRRLECDAESAPYPVWVSPSLVQRAVDAAHELAS